MLYAVLNKAIEHKFAIRHLDRDYINTPRISFYLDINDEKINDNIDYLVSLGTTPIVNIEIYNEQDILIANYSNKIPGVLLELSDRLENLLIGGNIERTIRAVITYVDPE